MLLCTSPLRWLVALACRWSPVQVFVDEFTCIGCRNCTNVCSRTFEIEDDWGRARVMRQGVDTEDKLQVRHWQGPTG